MDPEILKGLYNKYVKSYGVEYDEFVNTLQMDVDVQKGLWKTSGANDAMSFDEFKRIIGATKSNDVTSQSPKQSPPQTPPKVQDVTPSIEDKVSKALEKRQAEVMQAGKENQLLSQQLRRESGQNITRDNLQSRDNPYDNVVKSYVAAADQYSTAPKIRDLAAREAISSMQAGDSEQIAKVQSNLDAPNFIKDIVYSDSPFTKGLEILNQSPEALLRADPGISQGVIMARGYKSYTDVANKYLSNLSKNIEVKLGGNWQQDLSDAINILRDPNIPEEEKVKAQEYIDALQNDEHLSEYLNVVDKLGNTVKTWEEYLNTNEAYQDFLNDTQKLQKEIDDEYRRVKKSGDPQAEYKFADKVFSRQFGQKLLDVVGIVADLGYRTNVIPGKGLGVGDYFTELGNIVERQKSYIPIPTNTNMGVAVRKIDFEGLTVLVDDKGEAYSFRDEYGLEVEPSEAYLERLNTSGATEQAKIAFSNAASVSHAMFSGAVDLGVTIGLTRGFGGLGRFATIPAIVTQYGGTYYRGGLDAGMSPNDAAMYSILVTSSLGLASTVVPTEAMLAGVMRGGASKGFNLAAMSRLAKLKPTAAAAATIRKFGESVVKYGGGEMIEEAGIEKVGEYSINAFYNYKTGSDLQDSWEAVSFTNDAVLGFGLGLLGGGGIASLQKNEYSKSAFYQGVLNPDLVDKYRDYIASEEEYNAITDRLDKARYEYGILSNLTEEMQEHEKVELVNLLDERNQLSDIVGKIGGSATKEQTDRLDEINTTINKLVATDRIRRLNSHVKQYESDLKSADRLGSEYQYYEDNGKYYKKVGEEEPEEITREYFNIVVESIASEKAADAARKAKEDALKANMVAGEVPTDPQEVRDSEVSEGVREEVELDSEFTPTGVTLFDAYDTNTLDGLVVTLTDGTTGVVSLTEDGVVSVESEGTVVEVGNINDIYDKDFSEFGMEPVEETQARGGYTFKIGDKTYTNRYADPMAAVNYDENGNVESVDLEEVRNINGYGGIKPKTTFKPVRITGPQAERIALDIALEKLNRNGENENFASWYDGQVQAAPTEGTTDVAEEVRGEQEVSDGTPRVGDRFTDGRNTYEVTSKTDKGYRVEKTDSTGKKSRLGLTEEQMGRQLSDGKFTKVEAPAVAETTQITTTLPNRKTAKTFIKGEDGKWYAIKSDGGRTLVRIEADITHLNNELSAIQKQRATESSQQVADVSQQDSQVEPDSVTTDSQAEESRDQSIESQVENFGVDKPLVKPVVSLMDRLFQGLKKAGITAANTLSEWVGIGTAANISPEALKQIIGEVGAQNLPKVRENLQVAKDMESAGKSPKEIYLATGWERSKDQGKWKYDLLDDVFKLNFNIDNINKLGKKYNLVTVLDYPELYIAYPELKKLKISISEKGGTTAEAFFDGKQIVLGIDTFTLRGLLKERESLKLFDNLPEPVKAVFQRELEKDKFNEDLRTQGVDFDLRDQLIREKYPHSQSELDDAVLLEHGYATQGETADPTLLRMLNLLGKSTIVIERNDDFYKLLTKLRSAQRENRVENSDLSDINVRLKQVVLHELQHWVQGKEGFARGGNNLLALESLNNDEKKLYDELVEKSEKIRKELDNTGQSWYDADAVTKSMLFAPSNFLHQKYKQIAGEVEARNVERRAQMTPEQRRQTMLSESEMTDVAEDSKIYIYGANAVQQSMSQTNAELSDIKAKAQSDGTFMKAPNGKDSNLTENQWLQVRTQNFKDWFGDWENDPQNASKVIDENGEPMVVKHGTSQDFTEFRLDKIGNRDGGFFGKGFYFTDNKDIAESSAIFSSTSVGGEQRIIYAFLNIKNPISYSVSKTDFLPDAVSSLLVEEGVYQKGDSTFDLMMKSVMSNVIPQKITEIYKQEGYDGVSVNAKQGREIVVFNPNQIKSATDNVGTFSSDTDNILYQQDYTGWHKAPKKEGKNSLDDMSDVFPDDLYSANGLRYYADGGTDSVADKESYKVIVAAKGQPDKLITVYRAVPKGVSKINNGDWVTLSPTYAKTHGDSHIDGEYVVLSTKVKASDLFNEGSINEFGVAIQPDNSLFYTENSVANAQFRIEASRNLIEALQKFNGSPKAVTAIIHEIMHPTVVEIFNGARQGNDVAQKHAETIVSEYNKANPDNQVTLDEMLDANEQFKNGTTTKNYRAVQEFIAEAWEQYNTEGSKGFSKAFQDVLDAITDAFRQVYSSLTGKQLTPELRQMFDELLGETAVEDVVQVEQPKLYRNLEKDLDSLLGEDVSETQQSKAEITEDEKQRRDKVQKVIQQMMLLNPALTPEYFKEKYGKRKGYLHSLVTAAYKGTKNLTVDDRANSLLANGIDYKPENGSVDYIGDREFVFKNGRWESDGKPATKAESDNMTYQSLVSQIYQAQLTTQVETITKAKEEVAPSKVLSNIESMTDEQLDSLPKNPVIEALRKSVDSLRSILPNIEFYYAKDSKDFLRFATLVGGDVNLNDGGAYIRDSEGRRIIVINGQTANTWTPYHEALHAYLVDGLDIRPDQAEMRSLQRALTRVINESFPSDLKTFLNNYTEEDQASEYFVEMLGRVIANRNSITPSFFQKLKIILNKFLESIGYPRSTYNLDKKVDTIMLLNTIVRSFSDGKPLYNYDVSNNQWERVSTERETDAPKSIETLSSRVKESQEKLKDLLEAFINEHGSIDNYRLIRDVVNKVAGNIVSREWVDSKMYSVRNTKKMIANYRGSFSDIDHVLTSLGATPLERNNVVMRAAFNDAMSKYTTLTHASVVKSIEQNTVTGAEQLWVWEELIKTEQQLRNLDNEIELARKTYATDQSELLNHRRSALMDQYIELAEMDAAIGYSAGRTLGMRSKRMDRVFYQILKPLQSIKGDVSKEFKRDIAEKQRMLSKMEESLELEGIAKRDRIARSLVDMAKEGFPVLVSKYRVGKIKNSLSDELKRYDKIKGDLNKVFGDLTKGSSETFNSYGLLSHPNTKQARSLIADAVKSKHEALKLIASQTNANAVVDLDTVVDEVVKDHPTILTREIVYSAIIEFSESAVKLVKDNFLSDLSEVKRLSKEGRRLRRMLDNISTSIESVMKNPRSSRGVNNLMAKYEDFKKEIERLEALKLFDSESTKEIKTELDVLINNIPILSAGNVSRDVFVDMILTPLAKVKEALDIPKLNAHIKNLQEDIEKIKLGDISALNRIDISKDSRIDRGVARAKRAELALRRAELKKVVDDAIFDHNLRKLSPMQRAYRKTGRFLYTSLTLMRPLKAMMDVSAIGVQGGLITASLLINGRAWKKLLLNTPSSIAAMPSTLQAFIKGDADTVFKYNDDPIRYITKITAYSMVEFFRNIKNADYKQSQNIVNRWKADHPEAILSGLELTLPGDVNATEELYQAQLVDNMWVVGGIKSASEIHMSLVLNYYRLFMFESFRTTGKVKTDKEQQAVATLLNSLTGRAEIPDKLKNAVNTFGSILFAPRMYYSTMNDFVNLAKAVPGSIGLVDSLPRKASRWYLGLWSKAVSGNVVSGVLMTLLYNLLGEDDDEQPIKETFGLNTQEGDLFRVRLGNAKIDLGGRHSGIFRAVAQTVELGIGDSRDVLDDNYKKDRYADRFYKKSVFDPTITYLLNHLNPGVRGVASVFTGKDFFGTPYDNDKSLARMKALGYAFMPISVENFIQMVSTKGFDTEDFIAQVSGLAGYNVHHTTNMRNLKLATYFKELNMNYPNAVSKANHVLIKENKFYNSKYKEVFEELMGNAIQDSVSWADIEALRDEGVSERDIKDFKRELNKVAKSIREEAERTVLDKYPPKE
jgi:uncharacterized protein YidB (DUF937 family)